MEKPYDKIIENYKIKYNAMVDSEADLNKSDMTWATIFRDSLDLLNNKNISIEEAIKYLDKTIQESANNYTSEHFQNN
ncbi:hypothetical protein [Staphylococcus saprophyticus]|uniref:hypothetical protein n=1 Tax=Staphylococcus saprophyticus TaxID=29385 RepID=UPI0012EDBB6C|nr:hypothetical protein [Lactococcus lactis]MVG94959.1 hypothetical protein [Staphylococcus aureus]MVI00961.1 hypothetical protein [Staphylococcus aureus]MVI25700.1 hypothetical protein [Staphylococcus aureus]MVI29780.1 hypothetical protein [Staphylococcus aureus]